MPELAQIADAMSGTTELAFKEKLHYVEDIQMLKVYLARLTEMCVQTDVGIAHLALLACICHPS